MSEAAIDAARKDAELAAMRAELTKYRECVKNPGSAMEWIAVMQAEQVALRARVAELEALCSERRRGKRLGFPERKRSLREKLEINR